MIILFEYMIQISIDFSTICEKNCVNFRLKCWIDLEIRMKIRKSKKNQKSQIFEKEDIDGERPSIFLSY